MFKFKSVAITLAIFSLIGIIHGAILVSFNIFVSWLLIGIWLIFSFEVLKNIKKHREYRSPHNTAFFTIGPVFFGIFYSIWGNFTALLGENLIVGSDLYLSLWSFLFGLPYVIYGSFSLFRCFKKYNVIYFGTKSVNARKFAYFLGISILFFIIIYWISFYSYAEFYGSSLIIDLNLLILLIGTILILIIPGLLGSRSHLPQLTRDYVIRRTNRINNLTSPNNHRESIRTTSRSSPTPSTRSITQTSRSVSHSSRSTPRGNTQSRTSRVKTSTRTTTSKTGKPTRRSQTAIKQVNYKHYRPKAANLSIEDFKCIFCFKLPELPKDNGRGIIICPNCRYPAHADEFKDWLRTSGLCSRCNAPIPLNYRRNPKIISVKSYSIIYKDFLRKR
ncbi:MAG: hypothetical protein JSV62_02675 [Promethearchaeota archaeon]|nr:MAG: hypothetical protein JSV62_02675 [Candidatus Lokiarchaeota archaeon]